MSVSWCPGWDGAAYAANTGHHRRHDADFLASVPLGPRDRVLDLGCGSGDFTATVAAAVPGGEVIGLDPQPSMIEQARSRAAANQSFLLGPAQRVAELVAPDSVDVIVSRAVLHWVPAAEHPAVLAGCATVLRPGGILRVDAGGGDNCRAVMALLDEVSTQVGGPREPWAFAAAGQWADLLERSGFDYSEGWVRLLAQRRGFDREGLLGWLCSQVLQAYTAAMDVEQATAFRAVVADRVDELRRADGSYDVTFVRLDALARRGRATS